MNEIEQKAVQSFEAVQGLALDYLPVVFFLFLGAVISGVFVAGSFLLAPSKPDPEKNSAYECGFNAFDDARMKFDVRFYLVAILFIIFDLEVAFLFPWAISLGKIGLLGFWSMVVFLGVLTVGFIYEWRRGALEWE
ncbi:MAG: NADH-quinone oxidoreductase subunit A [Hyphomonas sp.]